MRLTTHTDFALRMLMYLATVRERVTAAKVALVYGVSAHHMSKVVNQLVRLGYVRSIRGIGGGIELAVDPAQVRLGDVVEKLEGNLHLLDCVDIDDVCIIQKFCKLKNVLAEAERAQIDALNQYTLASVIPRPSELSKLP